MEEKQLVKDCIKGSRKAQKALYERFAPRMYAVCLRYAKDADMAQDFLQEAFIRVFTYLKDFRFEGSFEGWIRRIVVNTAIEKLRQADVLKNSLELDMVNPVHYETHNLQEQIDAEELMQLIQSMPTGFRTVFNLFAIEGYTHQEVGNILNISEGTSKSQYARARMWLMQRLKQKEDRG